MFWLPSLKSTLLLLSLITSGLAAPKSRDIYQFPNTTWLENLAVRSTNGHILTGIIGRPELWEVNPFTSSAELLHSFPDVNSVFGITEYSPDVFAVAVGDYDYLTATPGQASFSVWSVNVHKQPAKIARVASLSSAGVLNGLTTLSSEKKTILAADSSRGDIYRVSMLTGAYESVLKDDLTSPSPGSGKLAVNGIHIHDGYLYFTNSYRYFMGRVPINADGTAAGKFEKFVDTKLGDDFAIDHKGNIFLAEESTLVKITSQRKQSLVVGSVNSTVVAGSTAAQFGKTKADNGTLYVVTNGGLSIPVNGTYVEGGKVVAVDFEGCRELLR